MLAKFWAIINALYEGHSLANVESWKNRQMALNSVLGIVAIVPVFMPNLEISGEQIESIAGGIVTAGSLVSVYLTTATSDKVGLSKKKK